MKIIIFLLCLLAVAYSQTQNKNGNPTGEIGQPAFDEIVVESTLTVRGKSGSRSGKSLVYNPKPKEASTKDLEEKLGAADGTSASLKRSRRVARQRFGVWGNQNPGIFSQGPFGNAFPGSSSSASHASSNAFNSNTPFGSFGASASQSASQTNNFGPSGFQGSAGQSASQTYHLPNGCKIDLSFSNSFSVNDGKPTSSNSHSLTITSPSGTIQQLYG